MPVYFPHPQPKLLSPTFSFKFSGNDYWFFGSQREKLINFSAAQFSWNLIKIFVSAGMKDEDNKTGAGKEEKATCGAGAGGQSCPLENDQEMRSLEKGTRISPQGLEVGRLWGRKRARESTEWSTPSADQRIYVLSLSAKAHPTTPPSSPYLKWGAQLQFTWVTGHRYAFCQK